MLLEQKLDSGRFAVIAEMEPPKGTRIADLVANATGAWAGHVLKDTQARVAVTPTPGVMVAFDQRLVNRAINRLNSSRKELSDVDFVESVLEIIRMTNTKAEEPPRNCLDEE